MSKFGLTPKEAPVSDFTPTPEQQAALALYLTGDDLVIEAGAGTGKTSTLILLAEATPDRKVQYVAFNKSIVVEAGTKMPGNVNCSTAHSLAFRAIGFRYKNRLRAPRMKSQQIARLLGIDSLVVTHGTQRKTLAAGYLAGLVRKAVRNFCSSADEAITAAHVPYVDGIDAPDINGRRTWENNRLVQAHVAPFLQRAWRDAMDPQGQLPFEHDYYLKAWQLSGPRINADVVMFDEAQDADPVMAAIVEAQTHAQLILVGDSQQAIYEWRGAVNALADFDVDARTFLTQSFRFGPAVADIANRVLGWIPGAELRLTGTDSLASEVRAIVQPAAVLARTNAVAVRTVMLEQAAGRRPHLIGGGREVAAFAEAAGRLMAGGRTDYHDLACFDTWGEVLEYVENDPNGDELRLLVKLVDEFGVEAIVRALDRMPSEAAADVVVSTAHKAKGREWDSVQLAGDFNPAQDRTPGPAEFRLLYVAVTRARMVLDVTGVGLLSDPEPEAVEALPPVWVDDDATRWVDGVDEPVAPLAPVVRLHPMAIGS